VTDPDEVRFAVTTLLAEHDSIMLSTCSKDQPWGAGAYFAALDPFRLTLVLESAGTTLRNIRANPQVALVIAAGDPFRPFLQARATAAVRDEDGKEQTFAALRARVPQIEPMLAIPVEALDLTVEKWRVTDIANGWIPGKEVTPSMIATLPT
jgi:hypothetical protein